MGRIILKSYWKEFALYGRIYQQITDIFAECSINYDPNSEITKNFYAMVQNKFHFAIVGQTAAEIIYTKADRTKPFMNSKTWKNAPKGRILKLDVLIAKNYIDFILHFSV